MRLSIEDLIQPLGLQDFVGSVWEKTHLYNPISNNRDFKDLFSISDVDRWIASTRTGIPSSILLAPPEGTVEGQRRHRPREVGVDSIYELFAKGYSIVLNQLEDSWPPVAKLVNTLGQQFCADVGINAYLTPKGSQTFPTHVDDHDAFILQVQGEKLWRLHEMELPPVNRTRLAYAEDLASKQGWDNRRTEAHLLTELRMRPGDVLYIPRGMPHSAAARDSTSLHLTVSITPLYWIDFVKAALEEAHTRSADLRRALPVNFVSEPAAWETMREGFGIALKAFQDYNSFDQTLDLILRNRIRNQGFPADGHFKDVDALQNLSLETEVKRRDGVLCKVELGDDSTTIRFGTRHISGPKHLREAFKLVRDRNRFKVAEVPGLDGQGKIVLVRRLIREGLLQFVH